MSKLKARKTQINIKKMFEREEAKSFNRKVKRIMIKIKVKAGENGKIFGGVTAKEISDGLKKDYQIDIDKKKIELK